MKLGNIRHCNTNLNMSFRSSSSVLKESVIAHLYSFVFAREKVSGPSFPVFSNVFGPHFPTCAISA